MTVVVGHIPTREGCAALEYAAAEVRLRGGDLVIVHPVRPGRTPDPESARIFDRTLASVRADLDRDGILLVERTGESGHDPAEDLMDVAAELDADCIVIGLRRRSAIGKLVLGSNAQRILLEARCPVIAVKARS